MKNLNNNAESLNPFPAVTWLFCTHILNRHVKLAIDSCLNQTYQNFELLIVVNGENRKIILSKLEDEYKNSSNVRVISTEVKHLPFSLNLGLHYARGAYIARMDSDDISKLDRLEIQMRYIESHPEVVVLGTAYEMIDLDGRVGDKIFLPLMDRDIRKRMVWSNPFCHPSVLLLRSAALEVGGYMGSGHYGEDYDLWSRLALDKKNKFANLSDVCVQYRVAHYGAARRSSWSYAAVGAAQYRNWFLDAGFFWLLASFATRIKSYFFAKNS
jgi:glycosyltransferase involved in cell wall biosynthesis